MRVNAVTPGPVATHGLAQLSDHTRTQVAAGLPLGRLGQPDEIAATLTWLRSEQASFITGATIPIDGGKLAGGA
jgi:NAD(P)-dependent dehydrogenase (short-subunit alcohol dehydrogenase family)